MGSRQRRGARFRRQGAARPSTDTVGRRPLRGGPMRLTAATVWTLTVCRDLPYRLPWLISWDPRLTLLFTDEAMEAQSLSKTPKVRKKSKRDLIVGSLAPDPKLLTAVVPPHTHTRAVYTFSYFFLFTYIVDSFLSHEYIPRLSSPAMLGRSCPCAPPTPSSPTAKGPAFPPRAPCH